jgi:hypothetical protein
MKSIHNTSWSDKRFPACILLAAAVLLTFSFGGCGGSGTSAPSGVKHRVFVSNQTGSATISPPNGITVPPGLQVVNADNDILSTSTITVPAASQMVTAGGTSGTTAVVESGLNTIAFINNSKETLANSFTSLDQALDLAITPDQTTTFAAIRNPGILDVIATNTAANAPSPVGAALNIPTVTRLVISPKGTKLLAFVDNPQNLVGFPATNDFFIIDVASKSVTPVAMPNGCTPPPATPVTCNQPFSAVFNNSETSAFILNCGQECGGTPGSASVVSVDFSGASPVFGNAISVQAATVGLLNGSNLFVAGTPAGTSSGILTIISTGNSTVTGTVTIGDGLHQKMAMASNNRLYIGATACSAVSDTNTGLTRGCLAIVNTSNSAVVFPEFSPVRSSFDVTAIQPIANRNVVYVAEGGRLDIFSTTTDQLNPTQIDIVGRAVDVVQVDQ